MPAAHQAGMRTSSLSDPRRPNVVTPPPGGQLRSKADIINGKPQREKLEHIVQRRLSEKTLKLRQGRAQNHGKFDALNQRTAKP